MVFQLSKNSKDVREPSSMEDYDGDGNVTEGIFYEIEGVQELLMSAIQGYAKEVAGAILFIALHLTHISLPMLMPIMP